MTLRYAFVVGLAVAGLAAGLWPGRGAAANAVAPAAAPPPASPPAVATPGPPPSQSPAPAPVAAPGLIVAVQQGVLPRAIDKGFAEPFAGSKGGAPVSVVATDGSIAAARAAHADLAVLAPAALAAGCKDNSLTKLDWGALGGRERQVATAASDCGEGAVLRSLVLAWNRDKFPGQPSWAEFWDVAKVPGKRGLRRGARGNLELALLADGVAPGDVYATLRTDAGVQRAFRKLDQLKPYLVWWSADADAAKLLESGEVLMTSAPAEDIIAAQRGEAGKAFPAFAVQWAGSLTSVDSFAILAGGAKAALATKFLAFAADPKNERALPALGAFGGAAAGANDGLPPPELAVSPSAPANLAAGLMVDSAFWQDNGAKLEAQYESWLAK